MKTVKFTFLIAILASVFLSSCSYNTMVEKQEATSSQWGQVQNAYQRRADLIPNLVATVKGYATHEEQTLTEVVNARAKATQITVNAEDLSEENLKKYQEAQGQLSAALGKLLMVQEQYPDLKANQNFLALQDELAGTENRIAVERNKYNEVVKDYNQYIRKFPQTIWAGWFGFTQKGYFEAEAGSQTAPTVQF
ncbi:LemA family protein [Dysgonomonas sp. HDW5A]|uniref:LemA family protein n=1 Tax=unclassified Dysgonomonas TaxID=2630389 RepID=UPI001407F893|nr:MULTISPECIES: LemA family protein [unclassified Dysgonomonas]QIK53232.1 LemA family protein [Dysgonomonas sp. HDW5B]QIK58651.1 LemA family protein [Dysgonomonas sp. HDW5A]